MNNKLNNNIAHRLYNYIRRNLMYSPSTSPVLIQTDAGRRSDSSIRHNRILDNPPRFATATRACHPVRQIFALVAASLLVAWTVSTDSWGISSLFLGASSLRGGGDGIVGVGRTSSEDGGGGIAGVGRTSPEDDGDGRTSSEEDGDGRTSSEEDGGDGEDGDGEDGDGEDDGQTASEDDDDGDSALNPGVVVEERGGFGFGFRFGFGGRSSSGSDSSAEDFLDGDYEDDGDDIDDDNDDGSGGDEINGDNNGGDDDDDIEDDEIYSHANGGGDDIDGADEDPTAALLPPPPLPLLFDVSPGTTGTRTLYHAACKAGYPSVHHKSFCVSSSKGAGGVDESVLEGLRAHFDVMALYIAAKVCAQYAAGTTQAVAASCEGLDARSWAEQMRGNVTRVANSGMVGLFDTPYPFVADLVLDALGRGGGGEPSRRSTNGDNGGENAAETTATGRFALLLMTRRDPTSWAESRAGGHPLVVCRERGRASEFDPLGCIDRALAEGRGVRRITAPPPPTHRGETGGAARALKPSTDDRNLAYFGISSAKDGNEPKLRDVFAYRPKGKAADGGTDEEDDRLFREGMARAFDAHQRRYAPLADYDPDLFRRSGADGKKKIPPEILALELARLVDSSIAERGGGAAGAEVDGGRPIVATVELEPLTCGGHFDVDRHIGWCKRVTYKPNKVCAEEWDGYAPILKEDKRCDEGE